MIILVKQKQEPLANVTEALAALIGSGVVSTFKNPDDPTGKDPFGLRIPATTQDVEVICDDNKAGYAKAGFYAAGFDVPTGTGAAPDPGENDPVTLTVTASNPEKKDDLEFYPIGIGEGAVMAAKALCGAFVTRPIGPNRDSYIGDNPYTSIQVSCNSADVLRVKRGFGAAHFTAE